MIGKIVNVIVFIVIVFILIKVFGKLIEIDERNKQACEEKGMIYVQPRGDRGYCTKGFRP